uniref:Similar to NRPB1 (RNA POLYMERASE II LARGE SUBUNIT) n=1 Tax=Arundo donax TaxID=35708 RepID=A0A0A9EI65_ARUDO
MACCNIWSFKYSAHPPVPIGASCPSIIFSVTPLR